MSALAATGGSPDGGVPSRLIMRLSPIDVKFSPVEMSLLMQLAGWIVLWVYCLESFSIFYTKSIANSEVQTLEPFLAEALIFRD